MKTFFICLMNFILVSAMPCMAHPQLVLKAPDTIPLFKEKPAVVQGWDELLKEGKLAEFYHIMAKNRTIVGTIWENGIYSKEEVNELLWIFYYVAKAPVFPPIGYKETERPVENKNIDFSRKEDMASCITRQCRELSATAAGCGVNKKQLAELMALYSAAINRAIYDVYDPDMRKKQEKLAVEYDKIYVERQKRWFKDHANDPWSGMMEIDGPAENLRSHFLANESRNSSARSSLDDFLAKELMNTLLLCFPGDKASVEKYLNLAGYRGEEMDEFIDRTVGRDVHTEFLYKGDRGRRHEMKLKNPPPPRKPEPRKPLNLHTPLLFD